jgi:outer membrane protein assembly factor BamD (BamD/ComL family)
MRTRSAKLFCLIALFTLPALAANFERGVMVRAAAIYIAPDAKSAKLGEVERGREVVTWETSQQWTKVDAEVGGEKSIAGWILSKGIITKSMSNGDQILYGEAVDSEDQASRRRGRRGAAQDAMRLYYRMAEYFPNSPLAGESLYRAADIRWQLDKEDIFTRPSSKERDPYLRQSIDDEWMKQVMKKFPNSKWADLAAFTVLDNKLCGDWQGLSKCPEKEADIYEKFANEHPQFNTAAQALYNAATRRAALIEIYKTEEQPKKSAEARARGIALCQSILQKYGQSDWAPRARRLLYLMEQNIPTFGNETE